MFEAVFERVYGLSQCPGIYARGGKAFNVDRDGRGYHRPNQIIVEDGGYSGFFTVFEFNEDGSLKEVAAYE
jgi:hypothetical protein